MKITFIVGLPGSGKTYLANELKDDDTTIIDDIKSTKQLMDVKTDKLILPDPNLCNPDTKRQAEMSVKTVFGNPVINWIYFTNDPEQCRINVKNRNDGREVGPSIDILSRIYLPDESCEVREVYKNDL